MNATLAGRRYRLGMRLSAEVATTFGLWFLMSLAAVHAVMIGLRALTPFDGDFSFYLFPALPLILTAVCWVHLLRAFPAGIAGGMTRKELLTAFAVFGALVTAGGFALSQLIVLLQDLLVPGDLGDVDAYGLAPIESLTRSAVFVAAGLAAGALMSRFGAQRLGGALAGVVVAVLLLRQIPLELAKAGYAGERTIVFLEYPSNPDLLAPLDAILALLLALVAWAALARAPMPHKKG
ncbi:hypothetical protein [Glycomyces sp. NRRL B-16210]|uniref:hypothetical protein n=1 Tax=Glycomyces sp. NRRL B-16210 TaxID=1463821 RepID=UPI0004BEC7B1|nr:hypothetical protein [Glycomyces sp. NRRL B-16210]